MKLEIKRPEKTVDLWLDASLAVEHEQLEEQLRDAQRGPVDARLTGDGAPAVAARIQELEKAAKENVASFRLRALPRKDWDDILAVHPPREGEKLDEAYGFDAAGVTLEAIPRSIIGVTQGGEPVDFDPAKDWDALADQMTNAQYSEFQLAVVHLNQFRVEVPFSRAAWNETRPSVQN